MKIHKKALETNNTSIFKFLEKSPKLFIYLITDCNFNCKHCYLGYRLKQNIKFNYNAVINILDSFALLNGKKDVTFLGGEPTLYPEINDVLKYAKEKGYYVRLDTNGFYNTTKLINIDLNNIDEISISLDGASPKTHDKIRTGNSFKFAINNIKYLKKIGKRIRITTTIMKPNLYEVLKIAELMQNIGGVDILNLHLLSLNGNARNHPELWVSPEDWLRLIVRIWKISDLRIRFPLAYLPKSLVKEVDKDFLKCEINDLTRLSFFPDGRVYCCSLLFDTDLNIGTYDFNKKSIFMRNNSEFSLIKREGSCIAKDFIVQQEDFSSICRFKKIQNDDEKYGNLILKINEVLKCREIA